MEKYSGKTVIVTGAANGIGRAIVNKYANQGANTIIADMNEARGVDLEKELISNGHKSRFIKTDVRNEKDVKEMVKKTVETFGGVDILINNAGISKFQSFFDMSIDLWDDIMNTNLRSVFLCSKEAALHMKSKGGSIINIASTRASMSEANTEAYSASKGGVISITHALAVTLGVYRIRVNSISPGWIATEGYGELRQVDHEQHPAKRVGTPEDIARCCLFLSHPHNDFITGENIVIDGGMTRKMIYED